MATKRSSNLLSPALLRMLDDRYRSLVRRLEDESGHSIEVRLNRNRWTYFSCSHATAGGRLRVSLHKAFLDAPADVISAIATLLRREDRTARRQIQAFIDAQSRSCDEPADSPPRPVTVRTRGNVYHLGDLFDELNRRYFGGQCAARITWGKNGRASGRRRHITFGTYTQSDNLIRIHPTLDRRAVPKYFVRFIVYHEMLHAMLPDTVSPGGRHLHHGRLFRQREREFDDYERARAWERRYVEGKT